MLQNTHGHLMPQGSFFVYGWNKEAGITGFDGAFNGSKRPFSDIEVLTYSVVLGVYLPFSHYLVPFKNESVGYDTFRRMKQSLRLLRLYKKEQN
jgi:hypothetical protein